MKDPDDIARMGFVIANYDAISYEGLSSRGYLDENGKPAPLIRMSKQIDGFYYVVEAVTKTRKKQNYVITAYKQKRQLSDP